MQAMRAHDLLATIGVNTHIGNGAIAQVYEDPANTIAALNYLGVRLIRDMAGDIGLFRLVCAATGTKMVLAIGESSQKAYALELGAGLALDRYLAALEGPNEPDDSYAIQQGGSTKAAAAFQPILFAAARAVGVPAIANSFGNIWPDPGSYGTTGDLSAWADYGNAHVYFDPHQCGPNGNGYFNTGMIDWVQRNARRTVPGKPVANTEFGWRANRNTPSTIAEYALTFFDSAFAAWNSPMSLYYGLFDDMAGNWGLFDNSGKPRPVATAIRNLITLLSDPRPNAATFSPGAPNIILGPLPTGENHNAGGRAALYQQASGDYWLSLSNEQRLTTTDDASPPNQPIAVAPATLAVSLPATARVDIFDPLVGLAPVSSYSAATVMVKVPTHPVLVRIRF